MKICMQKLQIYNMVNQNSGIVFVPHVLRFIPGKGVLYE